MLSNDELTSRLRGPPGPPGPQGETARRADTTWKASEIGLFNPGMPDKDDGSELVNGTTCFTNVEIFLDRMLDLQILKSEDVVRETGLGYLGITTF
ncbi:hypothetical protein N7467_006847 [Penicillium canescens]|nr:hypothetical protein N7467_006847 [Penicillium canescens]